MSDLPLSRIRILDFSLVWAGPFAVMMLGDLGAEIVRVESRRHHITNTRGFVPWPPDKEFVARLGHMAGGYVDKDPAGNPWNRHALFNSLGRNRRSVVAEIGTEEGHRTVEELVKVCDVLIENNSMGMMARHGLDYESVRKLNPSIIYVTMPLYGLTGPYHQHVGFGSQGEATAGYLLLRGYEDDGPMTNHGSNHMDASSGIAAAYATLMGIYQRDRTGESQFIEVSQTEHMTHQVGGALMDAAMNGRDRTPIGNRDEFRAPQGVYRCRGEDRWVAVSVGCDEEWSGLCNALGRPELADDPAYLGNLARRVRHDEIDAMISAWSADLRTATPWSASRPTACPPACSPTTPTRTSTRNSRPAASTARWSRRRAAVTATPATSSNSRARSCASSRRPRCSANTTTGSTATCSASPPPKSSAKRNSVSSAKATSRP